MQYIGTHESLHSDGLADDFAPGCGQGQTYLWFQVPVSPQTSAVGSNDTCADKATTTRTSSKQSGGPPPTPASPPTAPPENNCTGSFYCPESSLVCGPEGWYCSGGEQGCSGSEPSCGSGTVPMCSDGSWICTSGCPEEEPDPCCDDCYEECENPIDEDRHNAEALMASLSANKGASLGPADAPVTIVEFSDFECPYCRRFSEMLKEVLPSEKDQVRIVFHHLPLSIHRWARKAAEGAACAQLQSSAAFWTMQEKLFEEQTSITLENVGTKLTEIAGSIKDLDLPKFQTCQDDQMSLGLILRDINLASSNQIDATPTIFINGHRIQGVKSAKQLRDMITEAAKEKL